jgi:hypothetical protein
MISGGSAARVREALIAYDAGRDGGTERGAEPDFIGVARKRCDGRQPRRRGSIWQTGTVAERARPIVHSIRAAPAVPVKLEQSVSRLMSDGGTSKAAPPSANPSKRRRLPRRRTAGRSAALPRRRVQAPKRRAATRERAALRQRHPAEEAQAAHAHEAAISTATASVGPYFISRPHPRPPRPSNPIRTAGI